MEQDKQTPAEASSAEPEVKVETLEDSDLDVVTGGLASTGGASVGGSSCITAAP